MVSIASGIIKLSFGLLVEKFRDNAAERLKGKDLTDDDFRQVVVRELDDIKSKLDGLARKDLLSGISSFREGFELLHLSFGKLTEKRKWKDCDHLQQEASEAEKPKLTMKGLESNSDIMKLDSSSQLRRNDVEELDLQTAFQNLDSISRTRYERAKSSFEEAGREARRAFSNEALSTEDRVLAIKLRVMSAILQSLEDLEAAAICCKLYLEELHSMPAVREMVSVHLRGGIKSWFKKEKRVETISSVALVNHVIFNFTKEFAWDSVNLVDWPRIPLPEEHVHPIVSLEFKEMAKKIDNAARLLDLNDPASQALLKKSQFPSRDDFNAAALTSDFSLAPAVDGKVMVVNTKNEIIISEPGNRLDDRVKVFDSEGQLVMSFFVNKDGAYTELIFKPQGLAVDSRDNIYVVATDKYHNLEHRLFVFDRKGVKRKEFSIENAFYVAVSKTVNKVFVPRSCNDGWRLSDRLFVYDCSQAGVTRTFFDYNSEDMLIAGIAISDDGNVLLADDRGQKVSVYTERGNLIQQFRISPWIKRLGYRSLTNEIIVSSFDTDNEELVLRSYSLTGELTGTLRPNETRYEILAFADGEKADSAMAVSFNGYIVFLQQGKVIFI